MKTRLDSFSGRLTRTVVITDGKPSLLPVDANIPVGIVEGWS